MISGRESKHYNQDPPLRNQQAIYQLVSRDTLSASSACSGNFMSVSRATAEDAPVRGSTAARDGDKGSLCPSRVGFPTQRRPVVNGTPTGMPTRLLNKVRF
jgi:hypothetical protein